MKDGRSARAACMPVDAAGAAMAEGFTPGKGSMWLQRVSLCRVRLLVAATRGCLSGWGSRKDKGAECALPGRWHCLEEVKLSRALCVLQICRA
jgi:hypothetical protein